MSQQNVDLVERALQAFNRGDVEALLAMLSPDVEVYASPDLPNGGTFHGHDGFLKWIGTWLEAWDAFHVEAQDYTAHGEDVVTSIRQYGRGKGSGVDVQMNVAYLFTIRDGFATRIHLYPDRAEALEAVGLAE